MKSLAQKTDFVKIKQLKQYISQGFSIIPLQSNSKQPVVAWTEFQSRRMSEDEVAKYFKNSENVAIVCGTISNLIVIDADTQETVEFLEQFEEFKQTAKVKTRRGFHYYFIIPDLPADFGSQKIHKDNIKIDVKANGGYVVAPPSEVGGHVYEWLPNKQGEVGMIFECSFVEFEKLLDSIKEKLETKKKEGKKEKRERKGALTKLKRLILKKYTEGYRQDICLYLSGLLRKEGYSKEDVDQLITEICFEAKDKDIKQRISAVEFTFQQEDINSIKGLSGLIELGFDKEELYKAIKDKKNYNHIGNDYYEKDNLVFMQDNNGFKMLGPKIEIKAKVLDGSDIMYEIQFLEKTDYLKEVKDIEKIRKVTGLAIIRESRYLEWLNYEVLKCKQKKYIRKNTGWNGGAFYHPGIQTEDIWSTWAFYSRIKKYENKKDTQHELVKEALRDGRMLSFIYAFCLASTLNDPLNCNPSVCFLSGAARVGKTTVAQLGINLFLPAEDIFTTAYSTHTGFELLMKQMKDLPLLFDECILKDMDLEKIVLVASRVGKIRGTKSLTINISELNSNCIFTSEVIEQTQFKRAGAHRRFVAITIEDFQKNCFSKMTVTEIQKLKNCYGAGIDILKYLMQNPEIFRKHEELIERDIEKFELFSIYHIAKPVLTAIKVFEDFYSELFKTAYEWAYITLYDQKEEFERKVDIISKFKDDFSQFVVRKSSQIVDIYDPQKKVSEVIGQREGADFFILTKAFTEFCFEYGFEQKILIKELIRNNILKPYSHNLPRKMKKINGVSVATYHITLDTEGN